LAGVVKTPEIDAMMSLAPLSLVGVPIRAVSHLICTPHRSKSEDETKRLSATTLGV